jgi:hypothetical protein
MSCENANCHCSSEVHIDREGHDYCSESCAAAEAATRETCRCGHAGCSGSEELGLVEGAALAEDVARST